MRGLSKLLKEHGAAINVDLMDRGLTRADIGTRIGWGDLRDFIEHLKPTGDSAYFRAIKPRSWWVTPEYVATVNLTYAVELGNWQRAGGKKAGPKPKPPKLPEDRDVAQLTAEELREKRQLQREQLARARAAGGRRKTVERINPGEVKRGS